MQILPSLASNHGPVPTGLDVLALYQRGKGESIENIKDGRYVQNIDYLAP
jgi:hypothetical protein